MLTVNSLSEVATLMGERGWLPGMVKTPPSLHLMLSLHHKDAMDTYLRDVAESVATVRASSGGRPATQATYA